MKTYQKILLYTALIATTLCGAVSCKDESAVTQTSFTGNGKLTLKIADLDKDTKPDIVSAGGRSVYVLWNQGNENYHKALIKKTKGSAAQVQIGDLNKDGLQDIITADEYGNISVLYNRGSRTFSKSSGLTEALDNCGPAK